jgi:hypothetical protein
VAQVAQPLAEGGMTPGSVTEARAGFEIERYAAAAFQQEMIDIQLGRRAEAAEARLADSAAREADRELRQTTATAGREAAATVAVAESAVDTGNRAIGGVLRGLAAMMENIVRFLGDFFAPNAPPTAGDVARRRQDAEEERERRAERQQTAERLAQTVELARAARFAREREEEARARELWRERERGRDR